MRPKKRYAAASLALVIPCATALSFAQGDGMPLKPFAGLGSWAAFTKAPHGAMVMGDTVVLQDEVTPAMDAAFASGLEVTGLHNHFFYDEPKVYFMHVGGM